MYLLYNMQYIDRKEILFVNNKYDDDHYDDKTKENDSIKNIYVYSYQIRLMEHTDCGKEFYRGLMDRNIPTDNSHL